MKQSQIHYFSNIKTMLYAAAALAITIAVMVGGPGQGIAEAAKKKPVQTAPAAPVLATNVSLQAVTLTWNATQDAAKYTVESAPKDSTTWSFLAQPTDTSYAHTNLPFKVYYQYRVNAVSSTGMTSAWSNVATDAVLGYPKNVYACDYDDTFVRISWTAESNSYLPTYFVGLDDVEVTNPLTTQGTLSQLIPKQDVTQWGLNVYGVTANYDITDESPFVANSQLWSCWD